MMQTIKARYHSGRLEPLEPLDLEEGSEVLITSEPAPLLRDGADAFGGDASEAFARERGWRAR